MEREVVVKLGSGGDVERLENVYHLIEPGKLTMCERRQVALVLASVAKKCKELWPLADIVYLPMLPRHVTVCCPERGHMSEVDPQVIHRARIDLEEDIRDELKRSKVSVAISHWWEALGAMEEPELDWVRRRRVVSKDGVHLAPEPRARIAAFLLRRLEEEEIEEMEWPVRKRMSTW